MQARVKAHEVPMIPATIKMLVERVKEQMGEEAPDWEWVIKNLQEAYELALVGYEHAQQEGPTEEEDEG